MFKLGWIAEIIEKLDRLELHLKLLQERLDRLENKHEDSCNCNYCNDGRVI